MKYGIWCGRSLYRAGLLTAAARKLGRCRLLLWVCRSLGGTTWARLEHGNIIFSEEKEKKIMKYEQDFLCTTKKYKQLRQYNLVTIGYHM